MAHHPQKNTMIGVRGGSPGHFLGGNLGKLGNLV